MCSHAGLIPDIIDAFPDVEIAGSKVALMYLKGLTNRDFKQHPVKGGDKIDLGKGVQAYQLLSFVVVCSASRCIHDSRCETVRKAC